MLAKVAPLLRLIPDWRAFLDGGIEEQTIKTLRRHDRTGRPLGDGHFLATLENGLGRVLRPGRPGPKTCGNPK